MPRWYMEKLGGASSVDKFVAMAPLWRGTTADGLSSLLHYDDATCGSCSEFDTGSSYLNELNANGEGIPGVAITDIVTRYDEAVTRVHERAQLRSIGDQHRPAGRLRGRCIRAHRAGLRPESSNT